MTNFLSTFAFDSIFLAESLPPGELRTGTELYERVIAPWSRREGATNVQHARLETASDFLGALSQVDALVRSHSHSPILVIDAHGDREGMELASGEHIPWRDVAAPFISINEGCRCNLVVVASMCFGAYIQSALAPTDKAPAFAIIGPAEIMPAGDLLESNIRLFEHFLEHRDMMAALRNANGNDAIETWNLQFLLAEILFCRVYNYFIDNDERSESEQDRVNCLVAELVRRGMNVLESGAARAEIRETLRRHGEWYERLRRPFLMLDQFSENAKRFTLSYDQCRTISTKRLQG